MSLNCWGEHQSQEGPTAGTQGKDGEDWQERQEVAGCPELGEASWGMSVGRHQGHPGDGGRKG